jgi:hypothetical protein
VEDAVMANLRNSACAVMAGLVAVIAWSGVSGQPLPDKRATGPSDKAAHSGAQPLPDTRAGRGPTDPAAPLHVQSCDLRFENGFFISFRSISVATDPRRTRTPGMLVLDGGVSPAVTDLQTWVEQGQRREVEVTCNRNHRPIVNYYLHKAVASSLSAGTNRDTFRLTLRYEGVRTEFIR